MSNKLFGTNIKIWLYLAVILKYPLANENDSEIQRWIKLCKEDFVKFPNIFHQLQSFIPSSHCDSTKFLLKIHLDSNAANNINRLFGSRNIQFGYWHHTNGTSRKIVLKHLFDTNVLDRIERNLLCQSATTNCNDLWTNPMFGNKLHRLLEKNFHKNQRIDGIQIFPIGHYHRLMNIFHSQPYSLNHIWFLMNMNAEPLLLHELHGNGFPVPRVYDSCGFVMLQSYTGQSLYNFYQHPYPIRVFIAKQLLEAALMFTKGFKDYRIYLTDATPDNIVINPETYRATFIDLDSVILVDSLLTNNINSTVPNNWDKIHKHSKIDCDGCFAYVPHELASHYLSDINIFVICQLLNEDLYGNIANGLLHTMPPDLQSQYPQLLPHLMDCLHCQQNCKNRFDNAKELIEIFNKIITTTLPATISNNS